MKRLTVLWVSAFTLLLILNLMVLPRVSSANLQSDPSSPPRYVPGQLIVKYKDSVTECVHCLLKSGRRFRDATTDRSDSLDRLHAKYHVRETRGLFRTEGEEATLRGPRTTAALKRHHTDRADRAKRRFAKRSQRVAAGIQVPDLAHVYVLELPPEADVEAAAIAFETDPHVEYAHPDYQATVYAAPNDPYYQSSGSWGQPYDDLWGVKKLQGESTWEISQGRNMLVAVVDTGLDLIHPDIAANTWVNLDEVPDNQVDDDGNGFIDDVHGWDFASMDNQPIDGHGHGTHVAGTIAAIGQNELGIIGVAPLATILPVKGLDDQGSGTFSSLASAIAYAVDNGADVINNSWGCASRCPSVPEAVSAVQYAYALGAVVVFAAGNNNDDVAYYAPQNMATSKPIVVASTDHVDQKSDFSNYGAQIDVAAPGGDSADASPNAAYRNVLSLRAEGTDMQANPVQVIGTNYYRVRGTSMAAPHVAGLAALVLQREPTLTNEMVRQRIRAAADDILPTGWDAYTGTGRVNASRAVSGSPTVWVQLTSPTGTVASATELPILGTITGSGALLYQLEYGVGWNPTIWTLIEQGSGPIINGLLGTWVVTPLGDAQYTLRLSVQDSQGAMIEDRLWIRLDHAGITHPDAEALIGGYQLLSIEGTAAGVGFQRYEVVYQDAAGGSWRQDGVILPQGGLEPVIEGLLATLDPSVLTKADWYTLKLMVHRTTGTTEETRRVFIDPDLLAGWPKSRIGDWQVHPAIGDLNGDGRLEAITIQNHRPDGNEKLVTVYVWQMDGSGLSPVWPKTIDLSAQLPGGADYALPNHPTLADLDGDGSPELLGVISLNTYSKPSDVYLYVFRSDGTAYPGWPKILVGEGRVYFSSPSVADIDGNGQPDIAVVTAAGKVHVWTHEGAPVSGAVWPQSIGPQVAGRGHSSVLLIDVDRDGRQEAFAGSHNGLVYGFRWTGDRLSGWPQSLGGGMVTTTPAAADLDRDGQVEILASSYDKTAAGTYAPSSLRVWTPAGVVRWSKGSGIFRRSAPMVGNVDDDPELEIVDHQERTYPCQPLCHELYVWNHDSTIVSGWPVYAPLSPIQAMYDLEQDGKAEIAVGGLGPIILNGAGQIVWQRNYTGKYSPAAPLLADFDRDGRLELFGNQDTFMNQKFAADFYLWKTNYTSGAELIGWSQFQGGSAHRGKFPANLAPVIAPLNDQIVAEEQSITVSVIATDPDGDPVTVTADALPAGASFDPSTRIFDWTPTFTQAGDYSVTFTAADPDGLRDTAMLLLTVTNVNRAPVLAPLSDVSIEVGQLLSLTVGATDPDGDAVTYDAEPLPSGATLNATTGVLQWTPSAAQLGTHSLQVTASDGQLTASQSLTMTVTAAPPLAAYPFEEGSGTTTADASGHGFTGTLGGATWGAGRVGQALVFNGVNDAVRIGAASALNLTGDLTITAWVYHRTQAGADVIVGKGGCYGKPCPYALRLAGGGGLCFTQNNGAPQQENLCSTPTVVPLNQWTHVAAVRSGTRGSLYLNGVLVTGPTTFTRAPTANTASLTLGNVDVNGDAPFDGVLDEIRLYDRALSATEMTDLHASAGPAPDTTPPTVVLTAPANGSTVSGTIVVLANASDNVGVVGVQFLLDGVAMGPEDMSAPYELSWDTTTTTNGSHTLTAKARDAATLQTLSSPMSVTVSNAPPLSASLVASFPFEEGSGSTTADASAYGWLGTLLGPSWSLVGRLGKALDFDGVNDYVSVPNAPALNPQRLTLSAWVKVRTNTTVQRILDRDGGATTTYFLGLGGNPNTVVFRIGSSFVKGTSPVTANSWHHIAGVYDGTKLTVYLDGVANGTLTASPTVVDNGVPLTIGRRPAGGGPVNGLIDEVTIYDRGLSAAEITALYTQ